MSNAHISQVRELLLETLKDLRNKDAPMDIARAKAVAEVATVLVDSAKVEVDYLRATKQDSAPFLEVPPDHKYISAPPPPASTDTHVLEGDRNGINSITRHVLR